MRIVQQSGSASYSHFPAAQLLLPAPRIAGLLPASVQRPPDDHDHAVAPFIYNDPRLADLSPDLREQLYTAAKILLDVAIAHTQGTVNDHALNTALSLFRRAVTGKPMKPMTPAQYKAEADVMFLELAEQYRYGLWEQRD